MTTSPIAPAVSDADPSDEGWETARTDLVVAGIATSSGQFLSGLLSAGMLREVGRPEKLARYLFPDVDPAVVDEVFQLGVAAGLYAGRVSSNPSFHRDELVAVREKLTAAGFHAMAGQVARSAATASRAAGGHPADGETAREH